MSSGHVSSPATATLDCMITFLARHPEHRRQLVDEPAVIPRAVEELLRWLSPVMVVPRSVKQDCELRGVQPLEFTPA
jgi:cytochrome P450